MKKSVFYALLIIISLSAIPTAVHAAEKTPLSKTNIPEDVPAEIRLMINRLEEIKELDRSDMNRSERKALREEVRTLKSAVKAAGYGIYISAGAVIVILLILLLI
jgi:hypothetical protein